MSRQSGRVYGHAFHQSDPTSRWSKQRVYPWSQSLLFVDELLLLGLSDLSSNACLVREEDRLERVDGQRADGFGRHA